MDTDEMRNRIFLRAMLDAFEKKVLDFYQKAQDPAERIKHLLHIRDEMRKFPEETIGITAGDPNLPIYPVCDENTRCLGGVCVDNNLFHADGKPIIDETPFTLPTPQ